LSNFLISHKVWDDPVYLSGDYMIYFIITLALFIFDQSTKLLTLKLLDTEESFVFIENFLSFTHRHNTGGPWSIFDGNIAFFIAVTFIIIGFAAFYLIKHPLKDKTAKLSVALIGSGAFGNLVDRIFRGYVVDMIEVTFIDYPVFNFADCCIVVGCIIMCVYVVFMYKEPEKKENNSEDNSNGKI